MSVYRTRDKGLPMSRSPLSAERGGTTGPTLLLLHGLGATGAVWEPLLERVRHDWTGNWVICDLPGHGDSPPLPVYSFGGYAAATAELVTDATDVVVVGHSLGGVVGLVLSSQWFGVPVSQTYVIGPKVNWTDDELMSARRRAKRPVQWFASEEEAHRRAVQVAGLPMHTPLGSPLAARTVRKEAPGYRLNMDPAASPTARAMRSPGVLMQTMARASGGRVRMMCGARDPGVTVEDLRAFDASAVAIEGAGHSPHVERADEVFGIIMSDWRKN